MLIALKSIQVLDEPASEVKATEIWFVGLSRWPRPASGVYSVGRGDTRTMRRNAERYHLDNALVGVHREAIEQHAIVPIGTLLDRQASIGDGQSIEKIMATAECRDHCLPSPVNVMANWMLALGSIKQGLLARRHSN